MFFIACEKAEIQQSTTSMVPIEERSCPIDDCEDCPVDDCCCSIEILSDPGLGVTLDFCGTSGNCPTTMSCSVGGLGNCPDINGFKETITFLSQSQIELFCVPKNAPFGITLASPTNQTHQVRLTCQVGQLNPQFVTFTLNSPPARPYWETNDGCELISCF